MSTGLKITQDIVLQATLIFLFLGSLFSLAFGLSLLLGKPWVLRLNERTKRWVSTREALRPMDVQRDIEPYVYRWNVLVGLLLAAGAAFILYVAATKYDLKAITRLVSARASVAVEMTVQAAWLFGVLAALAGLIVGLVMAAKPQWLQAADAWANRYYSGRRATKPLETMNLSPDGWVTSSPKLSGSVIAVGSVYVAVVLGYLLAAGVH